MSKLKFCRCCGQTRGELNIEMSERKIGKRPRQQDENGKPILSFGNHSVRYCEEFCENGTVHGIRYFTENRTTFEKIWWLVSLMVSLYFCVDLIIATYIKWETSPVIVSFATKETPAWMVPFPTVTICPEAKVRPSVFNYSTFLRMKRDNLTLDDDTKKKFGYLSLLCDESHHHQNYDDFEKFGGDDIFKFFEEVQPNFFDNAHDCKFLGEKYECEDLFVPLITDDGICYTFNLIDRSLLFSKSVIHFKSYHTAPLTNDWTLERGYSKGAGVAAYPRRALFSGVPSALTVRLTVYQEDLDDSCGDAMKGFKVQITHPQRIPRVRQQHFIVPLDRVSKAAVAPDMMTTSSSVQNYSPKRRNCHLPSERSLKFFQVYSQNNCQIECTANYTLEECACVEFYMPRENGTKICSVGSATCLKRAKHDMRLKMIKRKVLESNGEILPDDRLLNCGCLPICTSMYYNVEYSQTPWKKEAKYSRQRGNSTNKSHLSMLQVFFKGNQFITSERHELYGSTDFFANVGGLLGLFIGISALSIVEIIYYLTLRIFCNIVMFGKRNWSGTDGSK